MGETLRISHAAPAWQDAVTKLIETAAAKWRQEEGDYRDDITVIVLLMPWISEEMRAQVASATATAS